jgi:hypothetical protein
MRGGLLFCHYFEKRSKNYVSEPNINTSSLQEKDAKGKKNDFEKIIV